MSAILRIDCDGCGKQIKGIDRRMGINEDHIMLRGRLAFESFNHEKWAWEYAFLTPSEHTDYHFCNSDCLHSWIDYRSKVAIEAIRKNRNPAAA